jgi:hypothetical protein
MMEQLPVLDGQSVNRDSNGVVTIAPMPTLQYVLLVIIIIFAIGSLVRGSFVLGIGGIVAGIYIYFRTRYSGTAIVFNPSTRILKIGTDPHSIAIPFDNIAGFDVTTVKEGSNFTEEKIMVMLKDGSGIHIGTITDANQKNRAEKVSRMINFLYATTGIVPTIPEPDQTATEQN